MREALERLLASHDFDGTPRSRAFLRFIVEEKLGGRQDGLTQTLLANQVFGRRQDFDPTIDPIVRIQAGRLRRSLERYYLLAGSADPVRIELPRGGYAPVIKWSGSSDEPRPIPHDSARRPEGWPSVVVGPFSEDGAERSAGAWERRFCERLAVELGRYGDVRVVLRSELDTLDGAAERTAFALSGHRAGHGTTSGRVVARLVDGWSLRQIWAEEFCEDVGRTEPHEEVARAIAACVASEHGVVARTLWAERRGRSAGGMTPYDAILRSYQFLVSRDARDLAAALDSLSRTVEEEPECGLAWVQLARLCTDNWLHDASPVETPVSRAVSAAYEGVSLDAFSQQARTALAYALFAAGEASAARIEARRALDLDPRSFAGLDTIGWLLTMDGDADQGPDLIRGAMARNPSHSSMVFQALWAHHLQRGELDEAWLAADRFRDRASFWPELMRACTLGHLGRIAPGRAEVAALLARRPEFPQRGRHLIARLVRRPALLDLVSDGLCRAGLVLA